MRRRGTITIFFLFILFISSLNTAAFPHHENFSDADEDLLSILAFLADTKNLCEQTISNSYEANATLTIDEALQLYFDKEKQNQSLTLADQITQRIKYSKTILTELNQTITSYQHLQHVLIPLKTMGMNIDDITRYHSQLLDLFQQLIVLVNQADADYDDFLSLITIAYQNIGRIRQHLNLLASPLIQLSSYYTIILLENQSVLFNQLMDRYESYLSQLLSSCSLDKPKLVLYTDETDYYVGETINFSGYFITPNGFISDQPITVTFDDHIISQVQTNKQGRFNGSHQTNRNSPATTIELSATTTYDQTIYYSDIISLMFHLYPSNLTIYLTKTHFQPNETRFVKGRLTTREHKGVTDTINLTVGSEIIQLQTNKTGYYSYDLSHFKGYGSYFIQTAYTPLVQYEKCLSSQLQYFIDEPTILSIHSNASTLSKGESMVITGYLREKTQLQGLENQSLILLINGKPHHSSITNEQGYYHFSVSTKNYSSSTLFLRTQYISTHPQWRGSSSEVLSITLSTGFFSDFTSSFPFFSFSSPSPFQFIVILLICVLVIIIVFTVLFYLKKRWLNGEREDDVSASHPVFPYRGGGIKQQMKHMQPSTPLSANHALSMKQKIISRYRTLLRFLSNQGISLKKTDTHRDIQQSLYTTMLPKKTVDEVTIRFEHARYAPFEIDEQDVTIFDEEVFSLITEYKE